VYIFSHKILNHLKWIKNEKIRGLKIKRVKVFSSKILRQNITNVIFFLLFCFWCLEFFYNISLCTFNDIKIVIDLVK
jgi:hypothetical protein